MVVGAALADEAQGLFAEAGEAEGAGGDVAGEAAFAEDLGGAAGGGAAAHVDGEEAVLGLAIAGGEEEVEVVLGVDVGDAVGVDADLDGGSEAVVAVEQRRGVGGGVGGRGVGGRGGCVGGRGVGGRVGVGVVVAADEREGGDGEADEDGVAHGGLPRGRSRREGAG
ncbi:MAG: hypothetical protein R3F65_20385 [bacterium]